MNTAQQLFIGCPKCKSTMVEHSLDPVTKVDFCHSCKGTWLAKGVLAKSAGVAHDFPDLAFSKSTAVTTLFDCSHCTTGAKLIQMKFSREAALDVDYCTGCEGIYLDFQELARAQKSLSRVKHVVVSPEPEPTTGNFTDYRAFVRKFELHEPKYALPLLAVTLFLLHHYSTYYYGLVFEGTMSLNIDTRPPPDGNGMIGGFLPLFKFLAFYGGPIAFAVFYYREWRFRYSAFVSLSIWMLVYVYCATVLAGRHAALHPDTYQCAIAMISTYPLIGISMMTGHFWGRVAGYVRERFRSNAVKS